jgi:hypothetical protein
MFFYRDQHKGEDDSVKDFWSGCVGAMCDNFGDFEMMSKQSVPS